MLVGRRLLVGLLSLAALSGAVTGQFFMKVDTLERCIIDSFEKDTEVMLRVKLYESLMPSEYELAISIKDIDHRYYEAQRFKLINEKSKNIIYTHLATTDAFICLQANKEIYVLIEIDTNVKPPENIIKSEDMQVLETSIHKSVREYKDFNAQSATLNTRQDKSFEVG